MTATPGPWMSEGDRVVTADGLVVADVRHAGTWITDENARLLAEAPALLAHLRQLVALVKLQRVLPGSVLVESCEEVIARVAPAHPGERREG